MKKLIYKLTLLFNWVYNFLFPAMCVGCGNALNKSEKLVCQTCLNEIPRTNFIDNSDNKISEIFWGLVNFTHASSLYYFHKDTRLQNLIHHLKYKGRHEIGFILGKEAGKEIANSSWLKIDYIIPIPLHPIKQKVRGYNQSEKIGEGLSNQLGVEQKTDLLVRKINTSTQTKKSKQERRENMREVFELNNPEQFKNMHFLIIDDVLTTGATLESAANALLQIPNAKISIYTLAFASQI